MKVRKLLSLALCAALGLGLCAPALAADADAELKAVTAKVKTRLDLDTEVYTDFRGWAEEDVLLGKRWSLEWSGDGVSLYITADEAGKVYSMDCYDSAADGLVEVSGSWYFGGKMNLPRLPQDHSADALAAAKDFLAKALDAPVETVELDDTAVPTLRQTSYRFTGNILMNGLSSPVSCSLTVRASDLAVTRFWRGDRNAGYLNGVPKAVNNTTAEKARKALASTIKMEAKYVLGKDGKTATVQYVPVYGDDYYVDGESGALVNLTELRQKLWRSGAAGGSMNKNELFDAAAEAPMAVASVEESLTQAEKDGAAILENALSKEELDAAVQKAWPEIGLDTYTLASAAFSLAKKALPDGQEATPEDYDVTCRLIYGRQEGEVLRNKYVTVDARTGALKGLSSRRFYRGDGEETLRYTTSLSAAQTKAEGVLKSFAGKNFAVLALMDSTDAQAQSYKAWEHVFRFAQKAGDWFYDGNSYTVGVDALDGTISSLSGWFDDEVTLVLPKSVITAGEAAEVYAAAMDLPFGYLEVPVSISLASADVMPLLKEAGYSYVLALKTGYALTQPKDRYVRGVEAESGKAVVDDYAAPDIARIAYDDVEGHWVKEAAEALAAFQIGLRGGSLRPADALTQLDMVALIASVDGYSYDPTTATAEETNWLYNHGYMLGLVTPETREEQRVLTRGELVKLILDAAGYARLAGLSDIFRCSYSDSAAIPAEHIGYAALAQGFGLVKGGSDGAYAAERTVTRAEAVMMLYQYMK